MATTTTTKPRTTGTAATPPVKTPAKPAAKPAPKTISVRSERAPTNSDGKLATAKIAFIGANDATTLAAEAKRVGMKALGNKQYQHPDDGSWVKMDADGRVQRGVKTVQFQGIPQPYVEPPDPATAKKLEGLMARHPRIPASMVDYAIAKIGIVTSGTVAASCLAGGFVQVGSTWVHSDGSWVANNGGSIRVGWMGYTLDDLPYRQGWL